MSSTVSSLSALNLAVLTKELNEVLLGGKIDKIYLLPKEQELLLQMHIPNKGRKILRCVIPNYLYVTDHKSETPEKPHGFCMYLRKKLNNARLRKITQINFERILDMEFETKETIFHLIIELFSKGNIILCDNEYKILSPFSNQNWSERTIRGGIKYEHPSLKYNFLIVTKDQVISLLKKTDKESVVKALAMEFGLGGEYAEMLCDKAKIDKNKLKLTSKEIDSLFKEIELLQKLHLKPYEAEKYVSYNEALDAELTSKSMKDIENKKEKQKTAHLSKTETIIKAQEKTVRQLEKAAKENQEKAEVIYTHYQLIREVLEQINKAHKKMTWKEIKEKLKDHKIIKDINENNKQIVIEIT